MGACININKQDNLGNLILNCCNSDINQKLEILSEKEQIQYYSDKKINTIFIDKEQKCIKDITNINNQIQIIPTKNYFNLINSYGK